MTMEMGLLASREGRAGLLMMNRPKALNALDLPMIHALNKAIEEWRFNQDVELALLEGAGGRAFCAGGDVRAMRNLVLAGDSRGVEEFFASEYAVNKAIADFADPADGKPWVSLVDGVCMGGGLGVSAHGSHLVVSEKALLAMPETAIGLFPDVGTSYVLPRLPSEVPGAVGNWLGLTGARFKGSDAVAVGLASHYVPSAEFPALKAALIADGIAALDRFSQDVPVAAFEEHLPAINRCFGQPSVPAIIAALEAEGTPWAGEQLATLRHMSPTSLFVTHELLRRGSELQLAECLAVELILTRNVTRYPDFAEGVRAVLVDKDQNASWMPPLIAEVQPAQIAAMFRG